MPFFIGYFPCIMVKFQFDERKSRANLDKHGISFIDAQALWNDPDLLKIPARPTTGEARTLFIGKLRGRHWSAVVTLRDDEVRIISVRRSRTKEVQLYESQRI